MKSFKFLMALLVVCLPFPALAGFDLKEDTASQEWCFGLKQDGAGANPGDPHTGETIANTEIKIVLPGGTTETNKNSGGATEIGTTGRYCATFDATDTATAGSMTVIIRNTGSQETEYVLNVLTDNWYDTKYGTDNLQAHVVEYTAAVITAAAFAADAIDLIWDEAMVELAQAAPSSTPAMRALLAALYMALRNQVTVDDGAACKTFSNDAGTVIFKKCFSDNGTVYTETEAETGP